MEYCIQDERGNKNFKYSNQLTKLAHRDQVSMCIELDDVSDFNDDLAIAMKTNTRRYVNLVSDIVFEMLPTFVQKDVVAKDALDVYIEHRLMMQSRIRQPHEANDARTKFPQELIRRL